LWCNTYINDEHDDWADWLSLAEFSYNNTIHEATSSTPFFLNKGRHPQRFPEVEVPSTNVTVEALQKVRKRASENVKRAQAKMKERWD
jgi:hypothetical protein